MKNAFSAAGTAVGVFGVLLCAIGVVLRASGTYWILGFESMTFFEVGVGVMVGACFLKLMAMEQAQRDGA